MYYANKIEIHLFLYYQDTTLYTFTQNVIRNQKNVAWKNVGITPCTIVPKMCVLKKKSKMVNVYKLLVLISKEEEIPYPNLPPTTTITTITTTMNLSRPSYYKKWKKIEYQKMKKETKTKEGKKNPKPKKKKGR